MPNPLRASRSRNHPCRPRQPGAPQFVYGGRRLTAARGNCLLVSLFELLMGPALGEAGPSSNFTVFARPARLVLAALMLIGRLEITAVFLGAAVILRHVLRRR